MRLTDWKAKAKALKREVYVLYLCTRHPDTPLYAKLLALLIVAYAMSPIDLIPDFIPVLGYLDDLVLIPFGITLLVMIMPKAVLEECRQKAVVPPANKAQRWAGAAIVVGVWALALYVTFRLVAPVFED